jgi:drug/metabolite transporter (DMT)-like permease
MKSYSPIHVLRWVFTLGTVMILLFGWNQFLEVKWETITSSEWIALAFIAIWATFFAYLLNIYSIKVLGSSATGTYIYTQPVFAAVIAALVFGEGITVIKTMSALLIFAGVFLVNVNMKDQAEVETNRE